eukprot:PhF_6_TR18870/c0_g1_i1/m.27441
MSSTIFKGDLRGTHGMTTTPHRWISCPSCARTLTHGFGGSPIGSYAFIARQGKVGLVLRLSPTCCIVVCAKRCRKRTAFLMKNVRKTEKVYKSPASGVTLPTSTECFEVSLGRRGRCPR